MLRKYLRNSSLLRSLAMLVTLSFVTVQSVQSQSPTTLRGDSQASRPVGGGGGDIIIFDVIDSVSRASQSRSGGGVVPDFVIVNGHVPCAVMVLGESFFPGVYEVVVDLGESIEFGLMWEQPDREMRGQIGLGIWF